METCPVCRASLNGASTCRRCRADLQKVQEIERRGRALAGAAMLAFAEGDNAAAARWLDRARAVHASPTVWALRRLMAGQQLPHDTVEVTCPSLIDPERTESPEIESHHLVSPESSRVADGIAGHHDSNAFKVDSHHLMSPESSRIADGIAGHHDCNTFRHPRESGDPALAPRFRGDDGAAELPIE
jgi:hypothetical protein